MPHVFSIGICRASKLFPPFDSSSNYPQYTLTYIHTPWCARVYAKETHPYKCTPRRRISFLSFFSHFLPPHPLVSGLCFIAHTRKERFLRHTRVHNKFARAPVWCNRRSPLSIISAAQSAKLSLNSSCYEIYQRARARLCLMRYTKLVARRCDACINYGEQQVFSIRGVGKATPWCGASEKREKETRAALYKCAPPVRGLWLIKTHTPLTLSMLKLLLCVDELLLRFQWDAALLPS